MEEISVEKLMELYRDTIDKCGTYLLCEEDAVIEYNIFEEFDIGVSTFFYIDNLLKLNEAGLISDELMEKSSTLRNLVIDIQQSDKWNVKAVRHSSEWMKVLELADEIKNCLG